MKHRLIGLALVGLVTATIEYAMNDTAFTQWALKNNVPGLAEHIKKGSLITQDDLNAAINDAAHKKEWPIVKELLFRVGKALNPDTVAYVLENHVAPERPDMIIEVAEKLPGLISVSENMWGDALVSAASSSKDLQLLKTLIEKNTGKPKYLGKALVSAVGNPTRKTAIEFTRELLNNKEIETAFINEAFNDAAYYSIDVMKEFLEKKNKVISIFMAFKKAVKRKAMKVVEELARTGLEDTDEKDVAEALIEFIKASNLEIALKLITKEGLTPEDIGSALFYAVLFSSNAPRELELIKALLAKGPTNYYLIEALTTAISRDNLEAVKAICNNKDSMLTFEEITNNLNWAHHKKRPEIVQFFEKKLKEFPQEEQRKWEMKTEEQRKKDEELKQKQEMEMKKKQEMAMRK